MPEHFCRGCAILAKLKTSFSDSQGVSRKILKHHQRLGVFMKKQLVVLMALATLLLAGCAKPQTAWITDLDTAKVDAQKSKKDLLLVFTGSDWNDPSKDLIAKVFTADFFKRGTKTYVMCNIDIVQDKKLMDATILEKNYGLATKYGVQELPFVALITSEGDVYAASSITDQSKTIDGFFNFLGTFKDARTKMITLKKAIKTSKGAEKAKNIDAFLAVVNPSQRESYANIIREVPGLDADGKAGLKGKYQLQVAYLDAIALYKDKKLTEAGDCFIKLTDEKTLNAAQTQEAWYMGAYMYAMSGTVDSTKVIEWLEKAIAADPENPGSAQIKATIEQLKANPQKVPAANSSKTK